MKFHSMLGLLAPIFAVGCAQSDPGITVSVKTELMADELVKVRNFNVDTRDGVVTLTGTVQSGEEEAKALEIARNTKGVSAVVDNIVISSSGEPGSTPTTGLPGTPATEAITDDAAIAARVKSTLLADPDVGALRIDVDTREQIVTLTGTVNSGVKRRAP